MVQSFPLPVGLYLQYLAGNTQFWVRKAVITQTELDPDWKTHKSKGWAVCQVWGETVQALSH